MVWPIGTRPDSSSRRSAWEWKPGAKSPKTSEPIVSVWCFDGAMSLNAVGTPANGRGSPADTAEAAFSARSASIETKQFRDD